jgi:hypothetical protein
MNPLAFSQRARHGINEIATRLLLSLGLPQESVRDLNAHSTIAVKIHGLPDVMLSLLDDRLWMWSELPAVSQAHLMHHAAAVLTILTTLIDGVEGGQPTLAAAEHGYEWRALVNLDHLQRDEGLLAAYHGFVKQFVNGSAKPRKSGVIRRIRCVATRMHTRKRIVSGPPELARLDASTFQSMAGCFALPNLTVSTARPD